MPSVGVGEAELSEDVFNIEYEQPANQRELGERLAEEYKIRDSLVLTSCSTCHR